MSSVDFDHWARLDSWTNKEAALLVHGKDPDQCRGVKLNTRDNVPPGFEKEGKFLRYLSRVNWHGRYGFHAHEIGSSPPYIIRTALNAGWDINPQLLDSISNRLLKLDAILQSLAEADTAKSSVSPKERNTMLKLILGLACGGFGIDPSAERNPKASEMRAGLERVGLPVDDGTIKKYLDEAKTLRKRLLR